MLKQFQGRKGSIWCDVVVHNCPERQVVLKRPTGLGVRICRFFSTACVRLIDNFTPSLPENFPTVRYKLGRKEKNDNIDEARL